MKKKIALITAFMCALMCVLPVFAQAEATLTTIGSATVTITPDTAVLNVGYSCENADPEAAQMQTANAIAAIQEAAKGCGVAEEDIVTGSLDVYPQYSYTEGVSALRGYSVTHMLSITVRDIDRLGEILDALLSAGVNQSYGITFASSMEEDAYLRALALAVDNAAKKADALAIASGLWLGGISSVREIDGISYGISSASGSTDQYKAAESVSTGETVKAGEISVTAQVEVVYEIR